MALPSEPGPLAARLNGVMRNTAPLLVIVALAALAAARPVAAEAQKAVAPLAVGDAFPRLEAEFLTGRKAVLPDAAAGKSALVMMGFTYDSRFDVEKWAEHVRAEYAANEAVTFFEVPVIGGMGRMAKWFIDSGMRKGTPKELHENVITVYGGVDRWKKAMGFSKALEHSAYLALLGPDGRVKWLHRGGFSDDALAALKTAISTD
jgi:hypothetical protein